jgi:hypothetical protein
MRLENYEEARWFLYRARKSMPNYEPAYEAINLLKQKTKEDFVDTLNE